MTRPWMRALRQCVETIGGAEEIAAVKVTQDVRVPELAGRDVERQRDQRIELVLHHRGVDHGRNRVLDRLEVVGQQVFGVFRADGKAFSRSADMAIANGPAPVGKTGRGFAEPLETLDELQTSCRSTHTRSHRPDLTHPPVNSPIRCNPDANLVGRVGQSSIRLARPRKTKKLTISMLVSTKTEDATAGSAPNRRRVSGARMPTRPAQVNVTIIDTPMTQADGRVVEPEQHDQRCTPGDDRAVDDGGERLPADGANDERAFEVALGDGADRRQPAPASRHCH